MEEYQSGAWTEIELTRFLYDSWNLIAEYDATSGSNDLDKTYTWGLDLSLSPQGAGGVGGLLSMTDEANSQTFYYAFDANGNVTQLIDESGSLAAHYEYSPFGQLTTSTGPMADANPFRFSTKYQDQATGLLYYGFRYYDAEMGRWLNRDPIGEFGGSNLYLMLFNDAVTFVDLLGLHTVLSSGSESVEDSFGFDVLGQKISLSLDATSSWQFVCCTSGKNKGKNRFIIDFDGTIGGSGEVDLLVAKRALKKLAKKVFGKKAARLLRLLDGSITLSADASSGSIGAKYDGCTDITSLTGSNTLDVNFKGQVDLSSTAGGKNRDAANFSEASLSGNLTGSGVIQATASDAKLDAVLRSGASLDADGSAAGFLKVAGFVVFDKSEEVSKNIWTSSSPIDLFTINLKDFTGN